MASRGSLDFQLANRKARDLLADKLRVFIRYYLAPEPEAKVDDIPSIRGDGFSAMAVPGV